MNDINSIFNKNEIENKLKNFQEGKDYSVSPTDEPNIKTYNFHNDKLRSVFRGDRVPVRVTKEAYDGKDYTYRGHFEEGKDYRYSAQHWDYDKNYQGNRGTDLLPDDHILKGFMSEINWDEHSRIEVGGKSGNFHTGQKYWEGRWSYTGKGNLNENNEPKKIEPNNSSWDFFGNNRGWSEEQRVKDLKEKIIEWKKKVDYLESQQPRNEVMIEEFKKDIKDAENTIRTLKGQKNDNNQFDLQKENQELRQQLATVQKQLAEVLAELKKLKNNSTGKGSEKLNQQIVRNEGLIASGSAVSESEVRDQINKSEALMKEFNTTVSPVNDNKNNSSLPYAIGGSVILALAGIISYCLLKKNRGKKVA